ncbi:hypothetical protein HZS_5143 [Henneguya salminicola]|nr:hypothetical protein HZS_5143 [Henneguya salminicola]
MTGFNHTNTFECLRILLAIEKRRYVYGLQYLVKNSLTMRDKLLMNKIPQLFQISEYPLCVEEPIKSATTLFYYIYNVYIYQVMKTC